MPGWKNHKLESRLPGEISTASDMQIVVVQSLSVSDSLGPHGLPHTRLPCLALSPRLYSNSCPLSQWCHPTISFSVSPFSSCPQSFAGSASFPMNLLFDSSGQSIGASTSASALPMNIQSWFPLELTGWSPCSSKDSQVFSSTTIWKHQFLRCLAFFMVQLSHLYITGKTKTLTLQIFVGKVTFLLLNTLSRFVILMEESEEGLKSLLMKIKEESEQTQHSKT